MTVASERKAILKRPGAAQSIGRSPSRNLALPLRSAMRLVPAICAALVCASVAHAAGYPAMAPLDQYMMDRSAEIALAKSAAPPSIADKATVLVLTRHGYETAVTGILMPGPTS